jgi:hypothetical protein
VAELEKLDIPNERHLEIFRYGLAKGTSYPKELKDKFPGLPGSNVDPPLPQYGFLRAHEIFTWSEPKDLVTARPQGGVDGLENTLSNFIVKSYDWLFGPLHTVLSFFILTNHY